MRDCFYLASSFACRCPTPFPLHIIKAISFLTLAHETELEVLPKRSVNSVLVGAESELKLLKSECVWGSDL